MVAKQETFISKLDFLKISCNLGADDIPLNNYIMREMLNFFATVSPICHQKVKTISSLLLRKEMS